MKDVSTKKVHHIINCGSTFHTVVTENIFLVFYSKWHKRWGYIDSIHLCIARFIIFYCVYKSKLVIHKNKKHLYHTLRLTHQKFRKSNACILWCFNIHLDITFWVLDASYKGNSLEVTYHHHFRYRYEDTFVHLQLVVVVAILQRLQYKPHMSTS